MKRFLLIISILAVSSCLNRGAQYVQIQGFAQGGKYTVKINMKGVGLPAETVRDSIDALLTTIDTTLSGYNRNSLLSRFNAGEKIPATPMFLDMYSKSYALWERSGGALDFAAGPLYDAWGFGFKTNEFPKDEHVAEILQNCGMGRLPSALTEEDGFVNPALAGFPKLNFNAIAQGYSCDVIASYLYSIGVKDMLVDIGEIWCDGVNPAGKPWSVGVDRPVDRPTDGSEGADAGLDGIWSSEGKPAGIVTSGNYRKYYIRDGRKYAHIINPITGYPVQHNLLSATVVSKNSAAESDAVATWCMVIGLEEARSLILGDPSLEGYLIYAAQDGEMKEWASPGFTLKD